MIGRRVFLRLEWALSLVLVVVAVGWAHLRDLPLARAGAPHLGDVAGGAAVGALLWLCIPLLRRAPAMRGLWDEVLAPFSRTLRPHDVVIVALLSGTTEELFFRGVLLPELGLVLSSVLFGALHALNRVYALWATLMGAAFALLVLAGGSLASAMAAHATYNLGALLVLRRSPPLPAPPGGTRAP